MRYFAPLLIAFVLLLGLFTPLSYAESVADKNAQKTLQSEIPKSLLKQKYEFLTLTTENDIYASNRDENYTNGVRLTYFDTSIATPKFINFFDQYLPFFSVNETTSTYYSIGQNLYTPRDITRAVPDAQDRPYAGFLYGAVGLTTINDNHIDDLEVTLGVVGPASLGEKTQKFVHENLKMQDPNGWDYQLKNEPILNIGYQRRWPGLFRYDLPSDIPGDLHLRLVPHAGGALGNAYSYASIGGTAHIMPQRHKWKSLPQRVKPAIPGNGYFYVPEDQFSWSAFAGFEGRAFANNIFLDGNTFKDSPSVDKNIGVLDLTGGVTLSYGKTQLSYTLNWRSKEFDNQDNDSLFGAISLGYRF